ncbi:MAG TPA: hypothetical protein VJJ25_03050 [Nitrosopumilaceae archaeon]|nr:hypothetical protein [Nitrosopumilaceae archaeon]
MKQSMYNEITIDQFRCHVCNTGYPRFAIGKKHVYATCSICERRDEVGLVFLTKRVME